MRSNRDMRVMQDRRHKCDTVDVSKRQGTEHKKIIGNKQCHDCGKKEVWETCAAT